MSLEFNRPITSQTSCEFEQKLGGFCGESSNNGLSLCGQMPVGTRFKLEFGSELFSPSFVMFDMIDSDDSYQVFRSESYSGPGCSDELEQFNITFSSDLWNNHTEESCTIEGSSPNDIFSFVFPLFNATIIISTPFYPVEIPFSSNPSTNARLIVPFKQCKKGTNFLACYNEITGNKYICQSIHNCGAFTSLGISLVDGDFGCDLLYSLGGSTLSVL